jgi:hypothetical protein
MNVLVLSGFTKVETEDCLEQYLSLNDNAKFVGNLYALTFLGNSEAEISLYDSSKGVDEFQEILLFCPPEMEMEIPSGLASIPLINQSGILPKNWRRQKSNVVHKKRDEQLRQFFYLPKEAVFQCDPTSMTLIAGRALKLTRWQLEGQPPTNQWWRTSDNNAVQFTCEEFLAFAEAADAYVEQVYVQSWAELNS